MAKNKQKPEIIQPNSNPASESSPSGRDNNVDEQIPSTTETSEQPNPAQRLSPDPTPINTAQTPKDDTQAEPKKDGKLKQLWTKYKSKKKITIPLTAALVLVILLAVPVTRYKLLSLFIKKDFSIELLDSSSQKPVTNAQVTLAGVSAITDNNGKATLNVKLGKAVLEITKKYYESYSQSVTVGLSKQKEPLKISVSATGRQVPVTVSNLINGAPIENAKIIAAESEVNTDQEGVAIIVLPVGSDSQKAEITADGYNSTKATITVTESTVKENDFKITPSGKIYFLSKESGKVDLVKTNLDGTDRKTVYAGTGSETDGDTILLASRDWKYLVLKSIRSGKTPKLYLINTSNDNLATIDEGNNDFILTGWQGHDFIYQTISNSLKYWQPKQTILKSYNADNQQSVTLYETTASGSNSNNYMRESLGSVYALSHAIIFDTNWDFGYNADPATIAKKSVEVFSIAADGSGKSSLKSIKNTNGDYYFGYSSKSDEPGSIYYLTSANKVLKYQDSVVTSTSELSANDFYDKTYPTYLLSPGEKETFWSESRDGGNTLMVGDSDGQNGATVAKLSELEPYGWYTDDYLLVSKNKSELYILSRDGGDPVKVSNYHKPKYNFYGYGGGYGGI